MPNTVFSPLETYELSRRVQNHPTVLDGAVAQRISAISGADQQLEAYFKALSERRSEVKETGDAIGKMPHNRQYGGKRVVTTRQGQKGIFGTYLKPVNDKLIFTLEGRLQDNPQRPGMAMALRWLLGERYSPTKSLRVCGIADLVAIGLNDEAIAQLIGGRNAPDIPETWAVIEHELECERPTPRTRLFARALAARHPEVGLPSGHISLAPRYAMWERR